MSMTDAFAAAYQHVLGSEGGYVDNPHDPGGATKYGITQRVARAHGYTGDMHDLPLSTAKCIAQEAYWSPAHCGDLDARLALHVFDGAYNSGVPQSVEWLQASAGAHVDGAFGPRTAAAVAVAASHSIDVLIERYCAHRLTFLTGLDTWHVFGRGWTLRIAGNLLATSG